MLRKVADIMGMPVTVAIGDAQAKEEAIEEVFDYLLFVDEKFSTYKKTSEISKINGGIIGKKNYSEEMKKILRLAEKTKHETNGYFDIRKPDGSIDPSGLVKGYAIHGAVKLLKNYEYKNFYIEIAGDIEVVGLNNNKKWKVGIENPFNRKEIIKIVYLSNHAIATSGTYIRGEHIYNPLTKKVDDEVVSVSIIADDVYEADRFATAVFAMGKKGIEFVEKIKGLECYMVLKNKTALMTDGFEKYTKI